MNKNLIVETLNEESLKLFMDNIVYLREICSEVLSIEKNNICCTLIEKQYVAKLGEIRKNIDFIKKEIEINRKWDEMTATEVEVRKYMINILSQINGLIVNTTIKSNDINLILHKQIKELENSILFLA